LLDDRQTRLPAGFAPFDPANLGKGTGTLPRLLREHSRRRGSELALREKALGVWHRYDWNHYYRQARRFALALLSLGITRGDRIVIASENTPEWYYADLGAELIGAVPVG